MLWPFIDTIKYVHTLKELVIEIPSQSGITRGAGVPRARRETQCLSMPFCSRAAPACCGAGPCSEPVATLSVGTFARATRFCRSAQRCDSGTLK